MLQGNFAGLSSIEPDLLPIKVLHCGNLDLDPITFVYDLDPKDLLTDQK